MKYISSILLLFLVNLASAQKSAQKPVRDYKPSAIRIGINVSSLLKSSFKSGFNKIEGQVDIDFHHLFLAVDYGFEKNITANENFNYENKGGYYRVGIQANIQPYNLNRNVFFFGFRYAKAAFEDKLDFINSSDKYGETTISQFNNDLTAQWYEMNLGLKVKVVKQVYFGYTIHFRFGQSISGNGKLTPRDIPGYGKSDKSSAAGFSYYISYNIPFRKKPIPIKLKKILKPTNNNPK